MVYPPRPTRKTLPEFVGTASSRPTPQQRRRFLDFVREQYPAGRSLRELAELTGRTQTAVRRALDELGIPKRERGAPRVRR
ncbi:MAG TPA: helix-turn-helix domain-containing protein [Mycobacterium sp.]|nr:helix-turn-helix domain-containing protein [Mycobacterium sp.]